MTISVLFFASLKERFTDTRFPFHDEALTPEKVWTAVCHEPLPANILVSINAEYAEKNVLLHDGDELAFFPTVTGG